MYILTVSGVEGKASSFVDKVGVFSIPINLVRIIILSLDQKGDSEAN